MWKRYLRNFVKTHFKLFEIFSIYWRKNHCFWYFIKSFSVCKDNSQCFNTSDTCDQSICRCGSNAQCTGKTDMCDNGTCKCGENDECSGEQYCESGQCKGTSWSISKSTQILFYYHVNISSNWALEKENI